MFSRAPDSVRGPTCKRKHFVARGQMVGHHAELVGGVEYRESLHRDRDERRMRDPGAIMAVAHFALLVGLDPGESGGVRGLVP